MTDSGWKIDGNSVNPLSNGRVVWETNRFFSLIYNGNTFHGEVIDEQLENGFLKVKVNHRFFTISKTRSLDKLILELGLDKEKIKTLRNLKAPMPGRVIGIAVKIGDEIEVGSELMTLEAMKMENVLKSNGIGKVKLIHIGLQQVVDKGTILITFE
jgi:biotin carboxyl carrier protein